MRRNRPHFAELLNRPDNKKQEKEVLDSCGPEQEIEEPTLLEDPTGYKWKGGGTR
jgi:hypothetical protein